MTRRGTTLIELVVVLAVAGLAIGVGMFAFHRLANRNTGAVPQTQRRAQKAILLSQVMEVLLRDVRSATSAPEDSGGGYVLERWVERPGGAVETALVLWRVDGDRVTRETDGEAPKVFDFAGLIEAAEPALTLRLEPVEEVLFEPDAPF